MFQSVEEPVQAVVCQHKLPKQAKLLASRGITVTVKCERCGIRIRIKKDRNHG